MIKTLFPLGPSQKELKEELLKYKAERSNCAKLNSMYSIAFKEFIGKIKKYRRVSKETRKGYDAIIESLENGLHAAKAMDPKYRLYRKAAIGFACVASLYLGTQLAEKPSVMPLPAPATYHSSSKAVHYSEHQKEHRPNPVRQSAAIERQASSQAYSWYFPVRGDTISKIAGDVTGDPSNWNAIKSYNSLKSDLIEVNQPLKIPGSLVRNKRNLYSGSLDCKVVIADGTDTLSDISRKIYGDSSRQNEILSFNRKYNPRFSERLWNREYVLVPR